MNAQGVTELPFGSTIEGAKQGCFLVLTAHAPIYERYPHVPAETQQTPHRVVFLVQRWDGLIGFPGGTVEAGESLEAALRRESLEEVNFDIGDLRPEPLCTHHIASARFVVHAFHVDLGTVDVSRLKQISRDAIDADHFLSEGAPFWAHLADYGRGKGTAALLASTGLTSAVREELAALLVKAQQ